MATTGRPSGAVTLTSNGQRFLVFYREAMRREIGSTPGDVAYIERVTMNMLLAATAHDQVNVSPSMRAAARKCGIETTRAAIFAFLRDAEVDGMLCDVCGLVHAPIDERSGNMRVCDGCKNSPLLKT